jgi:hypothetical protein
MAAHYAHHGRPGGGRASLSVLGRRPEPGSERDEETVYITPLGAAKEVGRSCVILKHRVSKPHAAAWWGRREGGRD